MENEVWVSKSNSWGNLLYGRPVVAVAVWPVGDTPNGYLPPGYNLEPAIRAPAGNQGTLTNLKSLMEAIHVLSAVYRGSVDGGTQVLPVWHQVSAARDCIGSEGPFLASNPMSVGIVCNGFRDLACVFVDGDPVSMTGQVCGFADGPDLPSGWSVSRQSILGGTLFFQEHLWSSTVHRPTSFLQASRAPTLSFLDPSLVPNTQVWSFGSLGGVMLDRLALVPALALCLSVKGVSREGKNKTSLLAVPSSAIV